MRESGTDSRPQDDGRPYQALIGVAAVAAVAGAAMFFNTRRRGVGEDEAISDAPASTFRNKDGALVVQTVTINRPRQTLYDFWRDFTNLPRFMDNIRSVEKLDEKRSHWVIEAPAGTKVEFDSRIVEDVPGSLIAWESEEGASVPNRGRVEFLEAAPGRGTMVRATISYDPPGGTVGRLVAKVLQREPNVQARRDLRRFKQLMETGEITNSASPSARPSEEPDRQYL